MPGRSSTRSVPSERNGKGAPMELNLSSEDAAFRDEVRAFIVENYPQEMRIPNPETDLTKEQSLLWHRILFGKGWIAPLWPKQYGGTGSYRRTTVLQKSRSICIAIAAYRAVVPAPW